MYTTLPFPYDYWTKRLTPGMAKKALAALLGELPFRVENIQKYIHAKNGVRVTPDVPDDLLNDFPRLAASLCRFDESYAPVGLEREFHPQKFDRESHEVIFDGALLLGEIFRFRYPDSRWAICRSPLSSIHYGQPVLVNEASSKRNEFGPVVELEGEAGLYLLKRSCPEWPLARLLRMRAFAIDLGPNPLEEPQA